MASVNDHENRIKKIEDRNLKNPISGFSFNINSDGNLMLEYNTEFTPNFKIEDGCLIYNFENTGQMNLGKVTQDLTPINQKINFIKEVLEYINSQLVNFVEIRKIIFDKTLGNGNITLTESYKNFDYLEILFSDDAESIYGTHRIPVGDLEFARSKGKPFEIQAWSAAYWRVRITSDVVLTVAGENSIIKQIRGVKMPKFISKSLGGI